MQLIPVLDLMNGKVVRGVAGDRHCYKPISESVITQDADPLLTVEQFNAKLGLSRFYCADLDLIQYQNTFAHRTNKITTTKPLPKPSTNRKRLAEIIGKKDYILMLDGGCRNISDAKELNALGVDQLVLGTETLHSLHELETIVDFMGGEKILVSIDLKEGKLVANSPSLRKLPPEIIVEKVEDLGINGIIVIELKKVGSKEGPLSPSLLKIASGVTSVPLFVGGGVRNIADLFALKKNGFDGALIATAFHNGSIGRKEIEQLK
jgi:phosphoribosylformimino-5-aminoimidazole carboxamide ribotide isomerase